jgi:hypothetical protein
VANSSLYHPGEGTFLRVEIDSGDLDDWLDGLATLSEASSATVGPALRHASKAEIRTAIEAIYDDADRTGKKPPNVKELPGLVQALLRQQERQASGRHILQLAPEFAHRRRRPGRTLLSENRRQ